MHLNTLPAKIWAQHTNDEWARTNCKRRLESVTNWLSRSFDRIDFGGVPRVTFLQRWGQNRSRATVIVCGQKISRQKYGEHTKVNARWSAKKPGLNVRIWAQKKLSKRRICKGGSMIVEATRRVWSMGFNFQTPPGGSFTQSDESEA